MLRQAASLARRVWGMRWLAQPGSSARLVARSGLFDAGFYREAAGLAGLDDAACLAHYMRSGAKAGLRPHPLIDPAFVAEQMGRRGRRNPLVAYLRSGWWRGVRPNRLFDPLFYLRTNPDVRIAGLEPLWHYAATGWREARVPSEGFDPSAYRAEHGLSDGDDPLAHALGSGDGTAISPRSPKAPPNSPIITEATFTFPPPCGEGGLGGAEPGGGGAGSQGGVFRGDTPTPVRSFGATRPSPQGGGRECATPPPKPVNAAAWATDEWTGLAPLPPGEGVPVDVVVPVYGGYRETVTTIRRVLEARNRRPCELVVVEDAPPDPAIRNAVDSLAARGLATVLRNETNRGFVASVNRGMALHPERDVVLLNADTEVFDGWLDRLLAHAGPRIATVTPLSNAATILSYPVRLRDNHMRLELPDHDLDGLAAALGPWSCEIPTGIGFCMFVSRTCLAEIGLFDEEAFGRGYGEENDFCRRAAARSWRNIAVGDVFVRHHSGLSFGAEKEARVAAAIAEVERRHPGYGALVGRFIREDPIAPLRRRLDEARIRRAVPEPVLLLGESEAGEGGVIRLLPEYGPRFGLYRFEAEAAPVTPNLPFFDPSAGDAVLGEMLERLGIRSVEIGRGAPARAGARLLAVARARGLPVTNRG